MFRFESSTIVAAAGCKACNLLYQLDISKKNWRKNGFWCKNDFRVKIIFDVKWFFGVKKFSVKKVWRTKNLA